MKPNKFQEETIKAFLESVREGKTMSCKCGNEIDDSMIKDGYAVCYDCAERIAKDIKKSSDAIGSVAAEMQMLQQEIDALNAHIERRSNELYIED